MSRPLQMQRREKNNLSYNFQPKNNFEYANYKTLEYFNTLVVYHFSSIAKYGK